MTEGLGRLVEGIAASCPDLIGDSAQVVLVTNTDARSSCVDICALRQNRGRWRSAWAPTKGTIGRNGFAAPGEKREGDGKTPSGIFTLGFAFGRLPAIDTRMPYRRAGQDDFWVDDAESPDYNRWVRRRTETAGMERMRRPDGLYRYGIVVEYNTAPVIRGAGSAIFFHVSAGEGKPTRGCVSMAEGAIVRLLAWLDPAARPLAATGTIEVLAAMTARDR